MGVDLKLLDDWLKGAADELMTEFISKRRAANWQGKRLLRWLKHHEHERREDSRSPTQEVSAAHLKSSAPQESGACPECGSDTRGMRGFVGGGFKTPCRNPFHDAPQEGGR